MAAPPHRLTETLRAMKALADPTRLRLVALLRHGELTVGELCRVLDQSQPRVSRHLRLLTEAGYLDRFREQQCVYYRVPASGDRAGWTRTLLGTMDAEDPALRRDSGRRAEVMAERLRAVVSQAPEERAARPAWSANDEATVGAQLRDVLGAGSCGELLDIGTRSGAMLALLGAQACHAVGVDASAPLLRLARARVHGLGLAHCEFHSYDMYDLPCSAACFDTITLDRVLAAAARPAAVLAEAARVLRGPGRLLVIEASADNGPGSAALLRERLQHWASAAGLQLTRFNVFALQDGQHLLALMQRSAAERV